MSALAPPACDSTPRWSILQTHFWLDLLTAVVFAAMAGTGVLLRRVLHRGSPQVGLSWLGRGRHNWADIHYRLGILLLKDTVGL
jgi:hypothetical protein